MRSLLALGLLLAGVVWPGVARAHPWALFGLGPRAKGMGGAHTAAAQDYSAVFYNPASLSEVRDGAFAFEGAWMLPELSVEFEGTPEVEAREVEDAPGIAFGAQLMVGSPDEAGRVGLGISIHVPTRSLLSGRAVDPAVPQWYLYESLPRRIVAALGLGWAPADWLSVGVSVQILAGVRGQLDFELDVAAGRFVEKTVVFDIEPVTAATLGVELRPLPELRLGLAWRSEIGAEVNLPVALELTELAELRVSTQFPIQFSPHELVAGASWRVPVWQTLLAADLTWQHWSRAPDPSPATRLDAGGALLEGAGLGEVFDAPAPGEARTVRLGLRDIFVLAVGVEQPLGPIQLRAGYRLRPTPVPQQTTGTNYIDASEHHVALGAGFVWRDPSQTLKGPLTLDLSAGVGFLPARRHQKVAGNDPIGSYEAGGRLWQLGIALRYAFEPG